MNKPSHEDRVRDYYDANTERFSRWEGRAKAGGPLPIHRRIWGPGVVDAAQALRWVHQRLAKDAADRDLAFDLGCGTGAALLQLAGLPQAPGKLTGVTLSPKQADEAQRWLGDRASIKTGSYLDAGTWPNRVGKHLYFAIESLVHCADPLGFRHLATQRALAGDRLVIADDFLGREPDGKQEERWLEAFTSGWRAPEFESADQWKQDLESLGWKLVADEDWSSWVDIGGFWRRVGSSLALGLSAGPPWSANLRGGAALVLGYPAGLFSYRYLSWEKL